MCFSVPLLAQRKWSMRTSSPRLPVGHQRLPSPFHSSSMFGQARRSTSGGRRSLMFRNGCRCPSSRMLRSCPWRGRLQLRNAVMNWHFLLGRSLQVEFSVHSSASPPHASRSSAGSCSVCVQQSNLSIDTDPQQQDAASPLVLVVRSSLR